MTRQASYGQRHSGLMKDTAYRKTITIVGCGAVGSHTALSLARMGYQAITLYDDDVVSEENMGSQGFEVDDIGKPKVEALAAHIARIGGYAPRIHQKRIDGYDSLHDDIVVAAVDSMGARRDILQAYLNEQGVFIDPRMGAEFAKLHVLNMASDERESYKKIWYSDNEAVAEACTEKATVYCANILAGFVVKAIKDLTNDLPYMRSMDFDIKRNSGTAWCSSGQRLF